MVEFGHINGVELKAYMHRESNRWVLTLVGSSWMVEDLVSELQSSGGLKVANSGGAVVVLDQPLPLLFGKGE